MRSSKLHCLIHICTIVINMQFSILALLLFCLVSHVDLQANDADMQSDIPKVRGVLGCSLPALLHIGARYRLDDIEIGFNVGSFPAPEQLLTLSADCVFHVFDARNETGNKSWFGSIGITSMHEDGEFEINDYVYTHLRFGHEFALSKSIGLQLDGGLMFELNHVEVQKKPSTWFDFDFDFPVLPSIGLTTVFYL